MKIKINPNLWGIGIDLFEIDLQELFGKVWSCHKFISKDNLSEKIQEVLSYTLDKIALQRYDHGPSFGGWGKDYKDRYYDQMYPSGLPPDVTIYPDSITFTGMIIDALRCISDAPQINHPDDSITFFNRVFGDAREYLKKRYQDGESGLYVSSTAGEGIVACNLRHTATAIFAWLRVKGDEGRTAKLFSSVINRLDPGYDYSKASASTIGCILGVLYLVDNYKLLKAGINIPNDQFNSIVGIAELELLRRFDSKFCLWDTIDSGLNNFSLWNALWTLKFAFNIGLSTNNLIKDMYNKIIVNIISKWSISVNKTKAIPLLPKGPPDIGATSCLLEILKFSPLRYESSVKRAIKDMTLFVIKYGNKEEYLKDTYSWTQASVINTLLSQGPWGISLKE